LAGESPDLAGKAQICLRLLSIHQRSLNLTLIGIYT